MILECETVGVFAANCYVLGCEDTKEAVVIDPGDEAPRICDTLRRLGLTVRSICLTHAHIDHVGAAEELRRAVGGEVLLHPKDESLLENLPLQAALFGVPLCGTPRPDRPVVEGEIVRFGRYEMSVVETPGHSPGGVCFLLSNEGLAFVGDTLFAGSVGRTDLAGGSFDELIDSIQRKLFMLEDDTVVYPGHGPPTTIGAEKMANPFVRE